MHGFAPDTLVGVTDQWTLAAGTALEITWTPPTTDVGTEVVAVLRIDQHGTTPSALECVFPDTGSGVVTAETMDALIDAGLTGFPAGGSAVVPPTMQTSTTAPVWSFSRARSRCLGWRSRATPCRTDAECPEGQTCNVELERCE